MKCWLMSLLILIVCIICVVVPGWFILKNARPATQRVQPIAVFGAAEVHCLGGMAYAVSKEGHMELLWNEDGRAFRCEQVAQ